MWPQDVNDVMHQKRVRRILGIWKKVSGIPASEEEGWLSLARRGLAAGVARGGGTDGNVVIERLCLSLPHVEKPFNSKVIKGFLPELRSCKCFCVSGFLCYRYTCIMDITNILCTGMNMSISRIHILIEVWVCYNCIT